MPYKIRKSKGGSREHSYDTYTLTVPREIAEVIVNKEEELRFEPELTEDGILYRPVRESKEQEVPEWAR
jgi:hypothetical protein